MTRDVDAIHESSRFSEVLDLFLEKRLTSTPVIDDNNHIKGILTHYDLLYRLFPSPEKFYLDIRYFTDYSHIEGATEELKNLCARDLMNSQYISVHPDDHILKACSLVVIHHISRLPVEEDEELVGIVIAKKLTDKYLTSILKSR